MCFDSHGLLVPYSMGNITFNVLSSAPVERPGYNDFYNTEPLFNFVKAVQVRITMTGHHDIKHPRHGYFGIYEEHVTAR